MAMTGQEILNAEKICQTCILWQGRAYLVDGVVKRSCVRLRMLTAATFAGLSGDGCGQWRANRADV